jgi:hypothetical protein
MAIRTTAVWRSSTVLGGRASSQRPADEADDLDLPIWAGQVAITQNFAPPRGADDLPDGVVVSPAVARLGRDRSDRG